MPGGRTYFGFISVVGANDVNFNGAWPNKMRWSRSNGIITMELVHQVALTGERQQTTVMTFDS